MAVTLNVCVPVPEQLTAGAIGCVVIAGQAFTVTVTAFELTAGVQVPLTTTS